MKLSRYFFHTLKESPSDAEIESHRLMIRAGFIKKVAPGIYSFLPLGLRVLRKFEAIIREEMNRAGALEILMPVVQPRELWDESHRWDIMGKGLLKFKDRNDRDMCLGATHEEVVTDIVRREVKSYRDLPLTLYQIQTKYRDEIRARFGLMRGKEFVMKDAYSFDVDRDAAIKSYEQMFKAYRRIFTRCGLDFRTVRADGGSIGGTLTHEFQVLAGSGEDQILACDQCEYASNVEITPALGFPGEKLVELELEKSLVGLGFSKTPQDIYAQKEAQIPELMTFAAERLKGRKAIYTPGLKTIEALAAAMKTPAHNLVKTLFYKIAEKKFLCILVRGDAELNEIKLKNLYNLEMAPELCNEAQVLEISQAHAGSCGPVGITIAVVCDNGLKNLKNWMVGANVDDFHLFDINPDTDFKVARWADLRKAVEGELCPDCAEKGTGGVLKSFRGIEVGHVFYLGDKYSKSMKATFLDAQGKAKFSEMGCYGIGVGRTVQSAIEQSHDKDGMIWPLALAPYQVLICLLDIDDQATAGVAEKIYDELIAAGVEVLLDDRNERPGIKFKDADLIGIPFRVNVGKKSLAEGNQIEIIDRKSKELKKVAADQASQTLKNLIAEKFGQIEGASEGASQFFR